MPEHPLPDPADFALSRAVDGPAGTLALGASAAPLLGGGEVLLLWGPLGAGKTLFTQGLALGLGVTEAVTSPTFTLVNSYEGRLRLHHLDFYRLGPEHDLHDVGVDAVLEDAAAGTAAVVVEWPEPLLPLLDARVELLVLPGERPDDRIWHLRASPSVTPAWEGWLAGEEASC